MRELESFGLNEYEEKTYKTILLLGESKPYFIAAKSGVPYGRIYDILESLVKKGFIRITMKRPKMYVAEDPEKFFSILIDEKIKQLERLKEETKGWKKLYEKTPEEAVYAVKGKEAFNKIINETERPEKIDYAIKYTFDPHPVWMRGVKKTIKKGVGVKILGRVDQETRDNVRKWLTVNKDIRAFPNKGVAMWITDNKVIIGMIKSDIALVVNDEAFVDIMKSLFESAWKESKEVDII